VNAHQARRDTRGLRTLRPEHQPAELRRAAAGTALPDAYARTTLLIRCPNPVDSRRHVDQRGERAEPLSRFVSRRWLASSGAAEGLCQRRSQGSNPSLSATENPVENQNPDEVVDDCLDDCLDDPSGARRDNLLRLRASSD
jgi:hypothetical protein